MLFKHFCVLALQASVVNKNPQKKPLINSGVLAQEENERQLEKKKSTPSDCGSAIWLWVARFAQTGPKTTNNRLKKQLLATRS
ncbi:MAG: hypothetical protein VKJ06_06425 [Vampirovibrionales bacterium]|nr:hypothetical protein [Vampirovibrionales bacterium]